MMNGLLMAFAFFTPQEVQALPKIAELESASGGVQIIDPKGDVRTPTKFGRRLKNSDIRDEDKIKTGEGAQAVLVFPDKSKYTIKEKTEVQILQKNLPKPTEEGKSVGRRIRLLFGDLVSEVMPNNQIRTDFETPAGSAAVRGTVLRMSVGAVSLKIETLDGVVRYYNTKFATTLDVGRNQAVRFVNGSLVIEVENDGGRPLPGRIGTRGVSLTQGDRLIVREPKGGGPDLKVDVDTGPMDVDGTPTNNSFDAPPGAGVASEDAGFDPKAATAQPLPEPPAGNIPGLEEPPPVGSVDLADTATNIGTCDPFSGNGSGFGGVLPPGTMPPTGSVPPIVIDDFNRPDDTIIGNGWVEEFEDWKINSGRLTVDVPPYSTAKISRDMGTLSSFNFEATFNAGAGIDSVELHANADPIDFIAGCNAQYFPSGSLQIGDASGFLDSIGAVTAPFGTDFKLSIFTSGSGFCGQVTTLNGTTTLCASSFN